MAQTLKTFVGDGSTTIYTFEFDYISKSFVEVLVDANAVGFTLTNTYQVTLDEAPAVGAVIIVRRNTSKDRLVDFVDGSVLVAADLNISALQAIHIASEADNKAAGSLLIDESGAYTAGFRRIADLGDPVESRDAVTKEWAETAMASELAQAINAANSAGVSEGISVAAAATTTQARDEAVAAASSASDDAVATAADRVATDADRVVTTADRIAAQAAQAATATSETNAGNSAATALAVATAFVPTGAVVSFASPTPPTGWIKADGTPVTASNPALRQFLIDAGSPYGSSGGDPLSPDLRAEVVRGWDDGRGVDTGRVFGSFQDHAIEQHQHSISGATVTTTNSTSIVDSGGNDSQLAYNAVGNIQNANAADETRMRNVALLYCIKT